MQQPLPWPVESDGSINEVEFGQTFITEQVVIGPSPAVIGTVAIVGSDSVEMGMAPVAAVVIEPAERSNDASTDNREMGSSAVAAVSSPPVDVAAQTDRTGRRPVGTQTPLPTTLYLPMDVSLEQLVRLLHATPEFTIEEITRAVSRQRPFPIPDEQLLIMDLVLHGMQLAEQRLVALVVQQQQQLEHLGLESEAARQHVAGFQQYVSSLVHRPFSSARTPSPAIDLANIPAEVDIIDGYGRLVRGESVPELIRRPRTFFPETEYLIDFVAGAADVADSGDGSPATGSDDVYDVSD